jgi:hypothetical protein
MKFNVQHKIPAPEVIKYPILMRWVESNGSPPDKDALVVLFTAPATGLVLTNEGFRKSERGWQPATAKCWAPFEGTLTFTR